MRTIDSKKFGQICDGVWRDRIAILTGRGILSGETALVRAVYWRLCKAGGKPNRSIDDHASAHTSLTYQLVVGNMLELCADQRFDGAPFLSELLQRYQDETRQSC
jgi:hypothetical protein